MLIQEFQRKWSADFLSLKELLVSNSTTTDFAVEHIGSTAVKGLAAKPIIDIDIVYEDPVSFAVIKADLERLGYYHNGDQGIPEREVFKRPVDTAQHLILDDIKHHLYVCPVNSTELKRHLAFRNSLRQNASARKEYTTLKYQIAELAGQDRKKYAELKQVMARELVERLLLYSDGL